MAEKQKPLHSSSEARIHLHVVDKVIPLGFIFSQHSKQDEAWEMLEDKARQLGANAIIGATQHVVSDPSNAGRLFAFDGTAVIVKTDGYQECHICN